MEGVGLREGEKQDDTEDFLVLTPGIGLDVAGDGLGQQYRTPEVAVLGCRCDIIIVIIVGRGIYGNPGNMDIGEVQRQAERYREAGWNALELQKCILVIVQRGCISSCKTSSVTTLVGTSGIHTIDANHMQTQWP